jgi:hypothetical protein
MEYTLNDGLLDIDFSLPTTPSFNRMAVPIQAREVRIKIKHFVSKNAPAVKRFAWAVRQFSAIRSVCQETMEGDESRSFPSSWISRLSSGTEKRCFNLDSLSLNSRMGFVSLGFD